MIKKHMDTTTEYKGWFYVPAPTKMMVEMVDEMDDPSYRGVGAEVHSSV